MAGLDNFKSKVFNIICRSDVMCEYSVRCPAWFSLFASLVVLFSPLQKSLSANSEPAPLLCFGAGAECQLDMSSGGLTIRYGANVLVDGQIIDILEITSRATR